MSEPGVVWTGPTIVALCVSGAATFIAGAAAVVSYLLFRSQSDPDVVIYAQADEGRPTIINLIIENKGSESAENVCFSWDGKLPARAFGLETEGDDTSEEMKDGPLAHGIPFFPPGARRVVTWGQYGGIYRGVGTNKVSVCIRYKSKRKILRTYRSHQTICPLDILSFQSADASDRNWDKKIAENLDELKHSIERESARWISRQLDSSEKAPEGQ